MTAGLDPEADAVRPGLTRARREPRPSPADRLLSLLAASRCHRFLSDLSLQPLPLFALLSRRVLAWKKSLQAILTDHASTRGCFEVMKLPDLDGSLSPGVRSPKRYATQAVGHSGGAEFSQNALPGRL